ncbi:MAG: hypothetical protein ACR2QV_08840 [Gammaproteobacteria bacterium]
MRNNTNNDSRAESGRANRSKRLLIARFPDFWSEITESVRSDGALLDIGDEYAEARSARDHWAAVSGSAAQTRAEEYRRIVAGLEDEIHALLQDCRARQRGDAGGS